MAYSCEGISSGLTHVTFFKLIKIILNRDLNHIVHQNSPGSLAQNMKTQSMPLASEKTRDNILQKALLACGILSSLYYVAINIIVPLQYEGYSSASQTVSELSAIGAPTSHLWNSLVVVYPTLILGFGWGILLSSIHVRSLRITGVLFIVYAITGFFWPYAPMHQREFLAAGGKSMSDTMHIVFSIITVLLMFLMIIFGALAFGKRFRLYSLLTILLLLFFGGLTGLAGPKIEANLPTPWIGIWERICIGAYLVWVAILATELLRCKQNNH